MSFAMCSPEMNVEERVTERENTEKTCSTNTQFSKRPEIARWEHARPRKIPARFALMTSATDARLDRTSFHLVRMSNA